MLCKICGCPDVRWLRVGTVAGQFKCSAKKVRRLIKRGDIDGVLLGGEWRIDHQSLDELVRRDSVRFSVRDEDSP
jgi:excisionase family DNA binding protein